MANKVVSFGQPTTALGGRPALLGATVRGVARAILSITLACSVLVPIGEATAHASTVFQVHSWNIAMGNDNYHNWQGAIDRTVYHAGHYPAWQISLQESCLGQASTIQAYLSLQYGQNWSMWFGPASPGDHACYGRQNGPFGNTIMAVGGVVAIHNQVLVPHAPLPVTEDKNIVCLDMQNFGFKTENCTAHTHAGDGYITAQQTANARNIEFIWKAIDGAYSLTGTDLNMQYSFPPPVNQIGNMPQGFQDFWLDDTEAHLPNWYQTFTSNTIPQQRMLDFVWADRRLFQQWGQYPCTPYPESDHRLCSGVFRIP